MNRSQRDKIEVRDYTVLSSLGDALQGEPSQRKTTQDIEREILAAERRKLYKRSK